MIYLFLLLLVIPLSLAVPQREGETLAPPDSTTIMEEVTMTVSPRPKSTTITKKGTFLAVTTTVSPTPKPTATGGGIPLPVGVDCLDPSWTPSVDAWVREEVDRKLKEWWESIPNRASKNFVAEFGRAFGDFAHNLACGVDTEDQCVNPSCKAFLDANAPKWTYFVRVAISNLNRFMRLLHDGIGDGQADFESLREDVAQNFLPWKDTRTGLEKAAPWIAAAFSTAAAFIPFGFAVGGAVRGIEQTLVAGVSSAGGAFAGGAFAQIGRDPAILPILKRMAQLSEMGKFVADYCSTARDILGKWSTVIFKGGKDMSGRDIFVYLRGGRFILHDEWTRSDLESFFKKRLVAWFVNHEVRAHTKTFILCANTTDPEYVISPNTQYITNNRTRVCSLYRLDGGGDLKDLIAVEKLSQYNITAGDVIQSSVEAYQAHGLDYTAEEMTSRLESSATLPSDQQWFSKGAAGEGAFTIPVCDVGKNTEWMGRGMPCCCGIGCKETGRFMEDANMGNFYPVETECKKICPTCAAVDYGKGSGNDASSLRKPPWRTLVGVSFAIAITIFMPY